MITEERLKEIEDGTKHEKRRNATQIISELIAEIRRLNQAGEIRSIMHKELEEKVDEVLGITKD